MAVRSCASNLVGFWSASLQSRWLRMYCARSPRTASEDAYQLLGLPHDCSNACIRAAFRALAKALHPDLQPGPASPALTAKFVRILAAYQILSDPQKRADYDKQVLLHRYSGMHVHNASDVDQDSEESLYDKIRDHDKMSSLIDEMEVVEWLRQYRIAVADMIHCHELGTGKGLQERLRGDLHIAIRKAYFGPQLKANQLFPDCFEADERAQPEVADILQLVSGRFLFGTVRKELVLQRLVSDKEYIAKMPHLMSSCYKSGLAAYFPVSLEQDGRPVSDVISKEENCRDLQTKFPLRMRHSGAYANLELRIQGKFIARATRVLLQQGSMSSTSKDPIDCISVYVSPKEAENYFRKDLDEFSIGTAFQDETYHGHPSILLGTIQGLYSTESDKTCAVHSPDGRNTHIVLQHKTPFVRHIHWYKHSEDGAQCECRCRRAQMLPSRFWLFKPRNSSHNIGGWYIEIFGRSKKTKGGHSFGDNVVSDSSGSQIRSGNTTGLLHPAMYIIAVAYKTLDEEVALRDSQNRVMIQFSQCFRWFKKKWAQMSS